MQINKTNYTTNLNSTMKTHQNMASGDFMLDDIDESNAY